MEFDELMRRRWSVGAIVALLAVAGAGSAGAQAGRAQVTVSVTRSADGDAIAGAIATIVGTSRAARTDSAGVARLERIERGTHLLRVRALGYAEYDAVVTIGESDSVEVFAQLAAAPLALDTVSVRGRATSPWLREFEARRARGTGYYVDAEELRRTHGSDLGSILMRRIPGTRVTSDGRVVSTRGPNTWNGRDGCFALVFIDGVFVPSGKATELQLPLIAGIEYYTPGRIPVQYQRAGSACGVVLMWTGP